MSILDMSASELAEQIKNEKITSEEATRSFINHIVKVNPYINALVEERFNDAILESKNCDQLLKKGRAKGRLFGVPISMKESFDVKGMKTTGGLVHRRSMKVDADAEVVKRLKTEGAIIIGKTNTPTLCFCQESDNKLFGRTNNPWDTSRTAGGSSEGEGALIAVGGAAVGIGSDIGGSIRFPAHFNGVIGFYPGSRQVSQEGHFPFTDEPLQEQMLGIGAIAKSVEDAALINSIISNNNPSCADLTSFKFVYSKDILKFPVDNFTKNKLENVISLLKENVGQAHIVDEPLPLFENSTLIWQLIMSIDGAQSIAQAASGTKPINPLREYFKEVLFKKSDYHRNLTWALIGANLFKPSRKKLKWISETVDKGMKEINSFLKDRIILLPVYHRAAPPHGRLYAEIFSINKTYLRYMPFIAYPNVWGLPSLVVPVGVDGDGLPIGIQLISRLGNERGLFHYGKLIEKNFLGYRRCTKLD